MDLEKQTILKWLDSMKNFIKEKLHEAFGSTAKLPKNLEINDQTHNALKSLTWQNIKLDSAGDDGHSKIEMAVSFTDPNLNFISEGINFRDRKSVV